MKRQQKSEMEEARSKTENVYYVFELQLFGVLPSSALEGSGISEEITR